MTTDIWTSANVPGGWRNSFAFGQQIPVAMVPVTGSCKSFDKQSLVLYIPFLSPWGSSFQQGGGLSQFQAAG